MSTDFKSAVNLTQLPNCWSVIAGVAIYVCIFKSDKLNLLASEMFNVFIVTSHKNQELEFCQS